MEKFLKTEKLITFPVMHFLLANPLGTTTTSLTS
jgi:hypothetical protein